MVKGYTQIQWIDYDETFSLVVRFSFTHLILAIATYVGLELFQMNMKTSFLNRELDEVIYMDQLIHFESKKQECIVCHLESSIYILR